MEQNENTVLAMRNLQQDIGWQILVSHFEEALEADLAMLSDVRDPINAETDEARSDRRLMLMHISLLRELINKPAEIIEQIENDTYTPPEPDIAVFE